MGMTLKPIPKLQDIAESPALVSEMAADLVETLLGKCSVVQGALVSRLLALRVNGGNQPERPTEGDRLLDVREAAAKLGTSRDYLYRNSDKLPFVVRIGRQVRYSEAGIEKFIRRRTRR